MDKRKVKVSKSPDGKTTTIRNKFGSGYKKESIFLNTSTVIDNTTDFVKSLSSNDHDYDPIKLVEEIENIIIKFLSDKCLPTEDFKDEKPRTEGVTRYTSRSLSSLLKEDYYDVIGVTQASSCLHEIACCKDRLREDDYKNGIAHALRLVTSFQWFTFAILEPTLSLGKSHQDKMIGTNTKLTNHQYDLSFKYFESLDKTESGNRHLRIGEKWDKTKEFAKREFQKEITTQSLRKTYRTK